MIIKRIAIVITIALTAFVAGCTPTNPTVRTETKDRVEGSLNLGVDEFQKGRIDSAVVSLQDALHNAYTVDDMAGQIRAMISLGDLYLAIDEIGQASNFIFQAAALAEEHKGTNYAFSMALILGKYYSKKDMYAISLKYYDEALASIERATAKQSSGRDIAYQYGIKQARQDPRKAIVYNNLGVIYRKQGDYSKALDILEKARAINESREVYDQLANNLYNLGEVYFAQTDYQKALDYYTSALGYDKVAENTLGILSDLERIADTYYKIGRIDIVKRILKRAFNVADSIGSANHLAIIKQMMKTYQ